MFSTSSIVAYRPIGTSWWRKSWATLVHQQLVDSSPGRLPDATVFGARHSRRCDGSLRMSNDVRGKPLDRAIAWAIVTLMGLVSSVVPAFATDEPIQITLERTACFGRCPVYTVTISGDGTVSYEGRQFVSVTGKQQSHVDPSAVRALVKEFEAIDFFALHDAYRRVENPDGTVTEVTDLPTQFVSLRVGDRSKRVEDYFGAPKSLHDLERRIDDVAGTKLWIEVRPSPSR